MAETRHSLGASAMRFAMAGGSNTILTAGLLAVLATLIDPRIAYALVFALGLVMSTWLAGRFVFGVRLPRWAVVAYVALYLSTFGLGLVVVSLLSSSGLPGWTSAGVVVITAPLTFVGGRLLTGRVARRSDHHRPQPTTHQGTP